MSMTCFCCFSIVNAVIHYTKKSMCKCISVCFYLFGFSVPICVFKAVCHYCRYYCFSLLFLLLLMLLLFFAIVFEDYNDDVDDDDLSP